MRLYRVETLDYSIYFVAEDARSAADKFIREVTKNRDRVTLGKIIMVYGSGGDKPSHDNMVYLTDHLMRKLGYHAEAE